MAVPYTFAGATSSIPLSQLDANFATAFTLGNTAIQLGNTVTTLNNMTLANVTISSGNVTITNVSVTTANVTTGNVTTLTSTNATLTNMSSGNVTITGGTINGATLGATTAASANVTTLTTSSTVTLNGGTANGVAYLNGSKVLTTGSALSFDGTTLANSIGGGVGFRATASSGTSSIRQQFVNTGGTLSIGLDASNGGIFGAAYAGVMWHDANYPLVFGVNNSEQMRLTSTGLGIGTSSITYRTEIWQDANSFAGARIRNNDTGSSAYAGLILNANGNSWSMRVGSTAANSNALQIVVDQLGTPTVRATLDTSGNLGLGVTPSANNIAKAFELQSGFNMFGYANLGYINANAYYNGGWLYKNTAAAGRYEVGDAHKWFTAPSGTAGDPISFSQVMTLDASGNWALGITSTSFKAEIRQSASTGNGSKFVMTAPDTGNTSLYLSAYDSAFGGSVIQSSYEVGGGSFKPLIFVTGNTERARITSGGDLLVGTTSAITIDGTTVNHAFRGTTGNSAFAVGIQNAGNSTPLGLAIKYTAAAPNGTGSQFLYCSDNLGVNRAEIRSNGGIANYQANDVNLSDQRLKTDIQPSGSYLDKICAIPVKTFLYKDQTDTERNLGVMAQDVDAVAPELIDHSGFGEAPEGESPYLAVYQTDLQYALMKCIQEQQAIITDLRARVAALEAA